MVLIRKHEQLARHLLGLQDVEGGEALGHGEAVVQLAVDDLYYCSQLRQQKHSPPLSMNRTKRDEMNKGMHTSSGVAHSPANRAGSNFSYPARFSYRVPLKSWMGKKSSSVLHWLSVLKTPSWQTRALNLRPSGWPWIQSAVHHITRLVLHHFSSIQANPNLD